MVSAFPTNFNLESFLHHIENNLFVVGDVVLAVACVNFFVYFVVVCDGYICSVILLLVMEFNFSPVFVLCSATKLPIEENYKRKTLNRKQGETLGET